MFNAIDALSPNFIEQTPHALWKLISPLYAVDEATWLTQLMPLATPSKTGLKNTTDNTADLIKAVRLDEKASSMIDALLLEYSLDTKEGILLMCLAEALTRVPDKATADAFIKDRLSLADWSSHAKNSESFFVNASTWGLMLTGNVLTKKALTINKTQYDSPESQLKRLVNRVSEPVVRQALYQAMKVMGHQFVLGRSIDEALDRGKNYQKKAYSYSFDMLGEAALTQADAKKYWQSYKHAIETVGAHSQQPADAHKKSARTQQSISTNNNSISIKLSALHPRYEIGQKARVMNELFYSVKALLEIAKAHNVAITIDAEEADRLELSLELFQALYQDPVCNNWDGLGIVVQAYSKRALPVLIWLTRLAAEQGRKIPVRLVKGAYWDAEIKSCQQKGFSGYPVFTRKESTDVSYLACAHYLLSSHVRTAIFPQFASHNAHTIVAIRELANELGATSQEFEFQRLHGMGEALYKHVLQTENTLNVRIYAPVGNHKDLLPYLVRRLLENGANSSFVHRLVDAKCPIAELTVHPLTTLQSRKQLANPHIKLPVDLFDDRRNSLSPNIDIDAQWQPFAGSLQPFMTKTWHACPLINGEAIKTGDEHKVRSPYDLTQTVGTIHWTDSKLVTHAIDCAETAFPQWSMTPVAERAQCLDRFSELLEENQPELIALCHREAGKTIQDSIDEVREAADFCRYYAQQARQHFDQPHTYTDYLGEQNSVVQKGRGVFACISPWNFPLAIFIGQISAALVAGNTVVAKPAEQTNLIAIRAIELLHQAGVPYAVVNLLPGNGAIGAAITSDARIAGVAFTGSTNTAQRINRSIAAREIPKGKIPVIAPIPVIAETGGQNVMLVDSTALPEQVVQDAIHSAFTSAGQRCSALRVLYVQSDIAEGVIEMLKGAMQELTLGLPYLHNTDIGPVIDKTAQAKLLAHIEDMHANATFIAQTPVDNNVVKKGTFIAPIAFEINSLEQLKEEQFGPILHVVRYNAAELNKVIETINASGFGLTMGIHSRNESTCTHIVNHARVGNLYINRDQIGAVVGVQPFGGQGLSGTGPKAGGPHYLHAFSITKKRTEKMAEEINEKIGKKTTIKNAKTA